MNRRALARLVVRSYPARARSATVDEIVATVLDASDGSPVALALQFGSVLRGGLRARAGLAARQPLKRLLTEGLGAGAMVLLAWTLAELIDAQPPRWGHGIWPVDLVSAPALWALGFRRVAGLAALLALGTHGLSIEWSLGHGASIGWTNPYGIALMLAGSLMLVATPTRTRPTIIGRLSRFALLILSSMLYVGVVHIDPTLLFPWLLCGSLALDALPFAPELSLGLGAFCLAYALQSSVPIGPVFAPRVWSTRVLSQWCVLPVALSLVGAARRRARAIA